jgi:uncharacterized protein (DUF1697 family)
MADKYVVLLRGINVNPTTRVAMADLRDIVTGLGYSGVTSILQSGNLIVEADTVPDAAELESAIHRGTGVKSAVVVLSESSFRTIVEANPLRDAGADESRLVIGFLRGEIVPSDIEHRSEEELAPEQLVITSRAVYQWCPDGILKSKLKPAWWKQFGPTVTGRNVRTAKKILAKLS